MLMTKEQLAKAAVKLGLQVNGIIKATDILKICLDESYKDKQNA